MSTISTTAAGEARFCLCSRREPLPDGYRGLYFPDTADACRKRYQRERERAEQARADTDDNERVLAEKRRRDLLGHPSEKPVTDDGVPRAIAAVRKKRLEDRRAAKVIDTDAVEERIRELWQECREAGRGYSPTSHSKDVEIEVPPLELRRNKPVRKPTHPLKVIDTTTGEVTEYGSVAVFTRVRRQAA